MLADTASTATQTPAADPPTLTARDAVLLQNLFALGRSLFALAAHHNLPLPDLIDWLSQPHIQAARDLIARELAEGLKSEALEILRQIARTSEDPVERRRATTQILRALNPPQQRRSERRLYDGGPSERGPSEGGAGVPPASRGAAAAPHPRPDAAPVGAPHSPPGTPGNALAHLAAAETFRSEVLNTYGPSLDESLDAEDDSFEDEEFEEPTTDSVLRQEPVSDAFSHQTRPDLATVRSESPPPSG